MDDGNTYNSGSTVVQLVEPLSHISNGPGLMPIFHAVYVVFECSPNDWMYFLQLLWLST